MSRTPYYAIYNVGRYTFSPYKVVWAEQSSQFKAAVASSHEVPVVGTRPYVPDHKIFFVAFAKAAPAYFLCGLLNAPVVREFVESHNISIQVGNIFKHMTVPQYRARDESHGALARLVEIAHGEKSIHRRETLITEIGTLAEKVISGRRS